MSNVLFGYPNHLDTAKLTYGEWVLSLPLKHLQHRQFSRVARSIGSAPRHSRFDADLGGSKPVQVIALVDHNLTTNAKWRITAGNEPAFLQPLYQSDWQPVWPYFGSWVLDWESKAFWSGNLPEDQLRQYRPIALQVLPQRLWAQCWRIEINDVTNPAGFVQIGRAYVCDGYQPSLNLSQGRSLGYESNTVTAKGTAGNEFFARRLPVRVLQAELDWLSAGEAYDRVMQMQRALDICDEVFYVEVPDDPSTYQQRAFPATLRKLSAATWPYAHHHRAGIELKECVG